MEALEALLNKKGKIEVLNPETKIFLELGFMRTRKTKKIVLSQYLGDYNEGLFGE